jgi:hypothetical protein
LKRFKRENSEVVRYPEVRAALAPNLSPVARCRDGDDCPRYIAAFRHSPQEIHMKKSTQLIATAIFAGVTIFGSGCAVVRSQESVGAYIDDTTITTQIKSRMASDTRVDAVAISVETLKGVVQLSGFAKSSEEKTVAEQIARDINGVRSVQNSIVIRRP